MQASCLASLADCACPYHSGRSETVHRFFHKGSPTMSAKDVKFSRDAREGIARGVDILANAVRVTLGPKGRNVLIDKSFGAPRITKDGVTVAKEIELKNKFENMGAQMIKAVASKTHDHTGDGTPHATVHAQA